MLPAQVIVSFAVTEMMLDPSADSAQQLDSLEIVRGLLERYLADKDQGAFLSLLKRHGPHVLATCRRVLFHEADVEDAFQALDPAGQ